LETSKRLENFLFQKVPRAIQVKIRWG